VKLGGLFSGVGGFELAWQQAGGEIAWMCEVEKKAQAVLRERFPGVTIYDDVRKLDPAKVEAVDILTGGSPCQGFSVAGKRTGLEHAESTLFHDYVRILDGLAERGLRWAVWENVPGVLSIKNPDGERTFPHVIAALAGAAKPVPLDPRRKWNVGLATHGRREVAWRVLDSQHFGVAQRRRRVFACVSIGRPDAGAAGSALLAVTEGVRGDTTPGEPARQEAPGAVAEGARSAGRLVAEQDLVISLQASTGGADVLPALSPTVSSKWAKGTGEPAGDETQNLTLDTPQTFRKSRRASSSTDDETWVNDGRANTLNTFDASESRTGHAVVEPDLADADSIRYGVRRLTPVECERLQGFPDGWTDVEGASDASRYRAMGNAVTVPTVRWILTRVRAQEAARLEA